MTSHGIILIPTYIDRIKVGHIVPGAPWNITQETPTSTVIDGNWGFGYVVTDRAMRYTIDKAKKQQVAAATVYRQSHIGRLAQLPADGGARGHDRDDHRRFRPQRQGGRAVRWREGAARHQSDLFRHPIEPGRAAVLRHGNVRRRGRQDQRRDGARRAGAGGLADRRGRQAVHRSARAAPGRRAAAGRRHRGLQGLRARDDRRDPVRPAHRSWLRRGTDRAAQRRLLHRRVQRRRVPRSGHVQAGGDRVRPVPEGDAAGAGLYRGAVSRRDRVQARTGPAQERHPGGGRHLEEAAGPRRRATACPTSWGCERWRTW